jgi:hypothetical protein
MLNLTKNRDTLATHCKKGLPRMPDREFPGFHYYSLLRFESLLMNMGPALRRSRRATPKKTSEYSVGDIVEV